MKFGALVIGHHPKKYSPSYNFQTVIEQVETARKAGFDFIWAGQHYAMEDEQKFQVVPSISRLAAESGDMHLGMNILLPLHHPVEIAEQFSTMDAITDGKIIFSPIAGYRDKAFNAFGISKKERPGRLVEGIQVIKKLWTEDSVNYDGKYYSMEDVTITPKPMQNPRPPIWVGANSDRAVKRASKLGDAWLVPPHDTKDTISHQLSLIDPPFGDGYRGVQPSIQETFVAKTDEKALEIAKPAFEEFYEWYKREGQHEAMETPEAIDLDATGLERFLVGSPETVADKLVRRHNELGIDCVIMIIQKPEIPHEDVLDSIEITGNEVIPRVRERISD